MNWQGAVVRIWDGLPGHGGRFIGSAFFIDPCTLLTARHVVDSCVNGVYLDGTPGGGREKIEEGNIYRSGRDIAVLVTSRSFPDTPTLRLNSNELDVAQAVTLAGFIDDTQSITVLTSQVAGHVSSLNTWRTQGNISKGMSGGPVMDPETIDVLGMIQARDADRNISFVISSDVISSCLKQAGISTALQMAPLYNVPSLPSYYLERNEHKARIIALLLQDHGRSVGITGISAAVGLQGMGGIGKSILAASIAHDNQVRAAFPDGVIWITVGQHPDVLGAQNLILDDFAVLDTANESPLQGLNLLNKHLADKHFLLILDDVWNVTDARYFDVASAQCKLLITTRHAQVLRGIGAEEYRIGLLPPEQAKELLRIQSRWTEERLPEEAAEIVNECGALPLAISMIGAMLRGKPHSRWQTALEHLQRAELKRIRQQFAHYPYPDLFTALHVSVEAQPAFIQKLYLMLSIFPPESAIPESSLHIYWKGSDLRQFDTAGIIDELLDASLVFRISDTHLKLHDLQRDYIFSQCRNKPKCHRDFVNAFEETLSAGIPDALSTYFIGNFEYHLREAKESERTGVIARQLLEIPSYASWSQVVHLANLAQVPIRIAAKKTARLNRNGSTIVKCLDVLGSDAIEDARLLLSTDDQPTLVKLACLELLGAEAKEYARRFVKKGGQPPSVIIKCFRLLGEEGKADARQLLRAKTRRPEVNADTLLAAGTDSAEDAQRIQTADNEDPSLIIACLRLLGREARDEARRLFEQPHQSSGIIVACIDVLGNEVKEEAKRLLKEEHQDPQLLRRCLILLGREAKDDARRLLKEEHQDRRLIHACLCLLGEDAKEDARRLLKEEHQDPRVINTCMTMLGAEAKVDARRLLKQEHPNPKVIAKCASLLGEEAKGEIQRLLQQPHQDPAVIKACLSYGVRLTKTDARQLLQGELQNTEVRLLCLRLLGKEAADDTRRLLRGEDRNPVLILKCLSLLGQEAKDEARLLLRKDGEHSSVIEACLRLLGKEAIDEARLLLKQPKQHPTVIVDCMQLLGGDAKEDAKRLLQNPAQADIVVCSCLKVLGREARHDALRLLQQPYQSFTVIIGCLTALGEEAKEHARRLLKVQHQNPQVICKCLSVLEEGAREDAQRLLEEEHQDPHVIMKSLGVVGEEAKEHARRLLKQEHQDPQVINKCLSLLGAEAKEGALHVLHQADQPPQVVIRCLELLGSDAAEFAMSKLRGDDWNDLDPSLKTALLSVRIEDPIRETRALELLAEPSTQRRPLMLMSALSVFSRNPGRVREQCRTILRNWPLDFDHYLRKGWRYPSYSRHIIKAMAHPELRSEAKVAALAILKKEQEHGGLIDRLLLECAQYVADGKSLEWNNIPNYPTPSD